MACHEFLQKSVDKARDFDATRSFLNHDASLFYYVEICFRLRRSFILTKNTTSRVILTSFLCGSIMMPTKSAWALPSGQQVASGTATFTSSGGTLTVKQNTAKLIANGKSFSTGSAETTRFIQPSSQSAALNRVTGGAQSLIAGQVLANGQVILVNPAGIVVGPGGLVKVGSFVARTQDLSNADFLNGGNDSYLGTSQSTIQASEPSTPAAAPGKLGFGILAEGGTGSGGTANVLAQGLVELQPRAFISVRSQNTPFLKVLNSGGTIRIGGGAGGKEKSYVNAKSTLVGAGGSYAEAWIGHGFGDLGDIGHLGQNSTIRLIATTSFRVETTASSFMAKAIIGTDQDGVGFDQLGPIKGSVAPNRRLLFDLSSHVIFDPQGNSSLAYVSDGL